MENIDRIGEKKASNAVLHEHATNQIKADKFSKKKEGINLVEVSRRIAEAKGRE